MPVPIEYDLKEILGQIQSQIKESGDALNAKIDSQVGQLQGQIQRLDESLNAKIDTQVGQLQGQIQTLSNKIDAQQEDITDIKLGMTKLDAKVDRVETELSSKIDHVETKLSGKISNLSDKFDNLDKRIDSQEFASRSIFIGVLLALLGGLAKMYFPNVLD